jgi:hypothetical protein
MRSGGILSDWQFKNRKIHEGNFPGGHKTPWRAGSASRFIESFHTNLLLKLGRGLAAILVISFAHLSICQGSIQSSTQTGFWPPPTSYAQSNPRIPCGSLRSLTGSNFSIATAELIPASGNSPEYCQIRGQIIPEIQFSVGLPTNWDRRFLMTGNSGFAGEPVDSATFKARMLVALRHGFVWAATNTGHDSRVNPGSTFARDPQKLLDYGFRSLHVTAEMAKQLATVYYGAPPVRSYFQGCSTGGRQGLILAQRFPDDFDGIVAGAPLLNFTHMMIAFAHDAQTIAASPIPATKQKLLSDRIYSQCDAKDGLKDGIIDDPRICHFNPAQDLPQCAAGHDGPECFTALQTEALTRIYSDIELDGQRVFPGWPTGSEADFDSEGGWSAFFLGRSDAKSVEETMSEGFFRDMVAIPPDPNFSDASFDLRRDLVRLDWVSGVLDATDPDLSRFRDRGGKLLMFHGWADQSLNPMMSVEYYERMSQKMGPSTPGFSRLFMIPGMFHCSDGVGVSNFDQLGSIVQWVESGIAPDRIVASRIEDDKIVLTRPICPYPQSEKYKGAGDVNDAINFACVVWSEPSIDR